MKSFLASKFRNIFHNNTQEDNVTSSRKRKRFDECESGGNQDDDVIITAVKRPKLTATPTSGQPYSFFSFFSNPYQKMSDWVKNRCSWSDMFNFRKIESDKHRPNGQGARHQPNQSLINGPVSSGTNSPCWSSSSKKQLSTSVMASVPTQTEYNSTATNGDNYTEDSVSDSGSISRGTQCRNRTGSLFDKKPTFTATECVQLEERERYRQLLKQFTSVSMSSKPAQAQNRERLNLYTPTTSQNESILGTSVTENLMKLDRVGNQEIRKQKVTATHSPIDTSFITQRAQAIDLLRPTSYARQQLAAKAKKPSVKEDTSLLENGDRTSDLNRTEVQAEISRRIPSPEFKDSNFLHEEWLSDLKSKYSSSVRDRERKINEEIIKAKIYEERRQAKEDLLEREIRYRMKITSKEPPVIEDLPVEIEEDEEDVLQKWEGQFEEKEEELPSITDEMLVKIKGALRQNPPDDVLVEGFRLQVTRKDMATLDGLNWLNDEIINFYMNMLIERGEKEKFPKVYAFNTFFYPKLMNGGHDAVRRWTRRIDVFAVDYIIIPVHLGMHWCLAVVDFKKKSVRYLDSMGGNNVQCLNAIKKYLCDESLDKKKTKFDLTGWTTDVDKDIPQQMNGSDCGMFACKYAEYITREAKITFTQQDMPYFRKRMVYEILTKTLLQ